MSATVIITGVSRGIGKATALLFLEKGYEVIGVGRSHNIAHKNFSFLPLDLKAWKAVENFQLPFIKTEKLILINNAGILGEIGRISELDRDIAGEVMQVNVVAPMQLTGKAAKMCGNTISFTLVNVSSGAGRRAIPSWGAYCASKAALDAFSESFYLEEIELGRSTKVYAVAPGVIDTGMQEQIRAASPESFSGVDNFKQLQVKNELDSPAVTALKLFKLLHVPYNEVVKCSLRDVKL